MLSVCTGFALMFVGDMVLRIVGLRSRRWSRFFVFPYRKVSSAALHPCTGTPKLFCPTVTLMPFLFFGF